MSIGEAFRAKILALADRVQQNKIDEGGTGSRIWYQRREQIEELDLSGNSFGIVEATFDVEVMSEDIDVALNTAESLKQALHGFRGDMSGLQVQAMFVADHADDYIPHNLDADEGEHIAGLDVQIFYWPE